MDSAAENAVPTIQAMRRQEETSYTCIDYLHQQQLQQHAGDIARNMPLSSLTAVTPSCREKMVQWSYKVVDFCHFNRETVSIGMSILDRYLMTKSGQSAVFNSTEFQLAAMTSLYTAVKIHEPEVMSSQLVSTLSRGAHTEEEVELMERRILHAVNWHVNPPTSLSFVRQYINLLPSEFLDEATKSTLYEVSKYQTELVVADYNLISISASTIAYASFVNALESLGLGSRVMECLCSILAQAAVIDVQSPALAFVQLKLCDAVTQQQVTETTTSTKATTKAVGTSCGGSMARSAPRRESYEASPCTVTRMEM